MAVSDKKLGIEKDFENENGWIFKKKYC
jgi:hypothetical protein